MISENYQLKPYTVLLPSFEVIQMSYIQEQIQ